MSPPPNEISVIKNSKGKPCYLFYFDNSFEQKSRTDCIGWFSILDIKRITIVGNPPLSFLDWLQDLIFLEEVEFCPLFNQTLSASLFPGNVKNVTFMSKQCEYTFTSLPKSLRTISFGCIQPNKIFEIKDSYRSISIRFSASLESSGNTRFWFETCTSLN